MNNTARLKLQFQQGHYDEVLSSTIDSPDFDLEISQFPWVIGSLSLVGRNPEAQGLFRSVSAMPEADETTLVVARFFCALSICRARNFQEAKNMFLDNLKLLSKSKKLSEGSAIQQFYIYQGLAFFRFSIGRYRQALLWSRKAIDAAAVSQDLYANVLAYELLGHIQCRLGFVHIGLRHINLSAKKAKTLKAEALVHAAMSSHVRYESQFGLKTLADNIAALKQQIEECHFDESYSRALLRISLAHQYIFKGWLTQANEQLSEAAKYVFQVDNPLLEIRYKICLAEILYQKGQLAQALPLLKESAQKAKEKVHFDLLLACLGFQEKLVRELNIQDRNAERVMEIKRLTRLSGNCIASNIMSRSGLGGESPGNCEDRLGDLLDVIQRGGEPAIRMIFKQGYLIFLKKLLNVQPTAKVIYVGIEEKHVTVFSEGEVWHSNIQFTNLSARFLTALGESSIWSKGLITERIWGQAYNPLRHDNLIYNLINRTRKLLGPFSQWLYNDENGYCLAANVEVRCMTFNSQLEEDGGKMQEEIPGIITSDSAPISHLSFRQNQIYSLLKDLGRLQTRDLVDRFDISEATAARDFVTLLKNNLVVRNGTGRATFYTLSN